MQINPPTNDSQRLKFLANMTLEADSQVRLQAEIFTPQQVAHIKELYERFAKEKYRYESFCEERKAKSNEYESMRRKMQGTVYSIRAFVKNVARNRQKKAQRILSRYGLPPKAIKNHSFPILLQLLKKVITSVPSALQHNYPPLHEPDAEAVQALIKEAHDLFDRGNRMEMEAIKRNQDQAALRKEVAELFDDLWALFKYHYRKMKRPAFRAHMRRKGFRFRK